MTYPRGLSADEQAAWSRLAASVTPLAGQVRKASAIPDNAAAASKATVTAKTAAAKPRAKPLVRKTTPAPKPAPQPIAETTQGLDSHWERRFKGGRVEPDLTLDLHGHTLDTAYTRISAGLDQARAMNARVVLVTAGRERPVDPADRANRRGAIRAKLLDWLAAGPHADSISAVRRAHRSHGGDGALYLVLKRKR